MQHRKQRSRVIPGGAVRLSLLFVAVVGLAACSAHPRWNPAVAAKINPAMAPLEVKVFFDTDGCPKDAYPLEPELETRLGQRVAWHAYRGSRDDAVFDEKISFAIYFDPFVDGKPIVSKEGIATSTPINLNTPRQFPDHDPVVYKYTVLGAEARCVPVPLDPRLRVMD